MHPGPASSTPHVPTRLAQRNLLVFTTISAIDGTIVLLAAAGMFEDLAGAIVAGLTVVAGAGAWISARDAYPRGGGLPWKRLLGVALPAGLLTVAAVLVGTHLGTVDLHLLPKAAGLALLLVAIEVSGRPLPGIGAVRFPLPLAIVLLAIPLEVSLHWTP